jgi:hypothetical protein
MPVQPAGAVSASSTYIQLYPGQKEAYVNGEQAILDVPVQQIENNLYVPAKWLGDQLGFSVEWNDLSGKVQMLTPKAYIEFDLARENVTVNGQSVDFHTAASVKDDRLMVNLSWLAGYVGFKTAYNKGQLRTDIVYLKTPDSGYPETAYPEDDMPNSRPVAKFMFGKHTYRIGEPVDYIDLSYDPDAEGLPRYEWSGREDAFFQPGEYTVSLKVTDPKGNVSDEYSRRIKIVDELFLDPFRYGLYYKPAGSLLKTDWDKEYAALAKLQQPAKIVRHYEDRPLIVLETPADLGQKGFLYRETVNGKARLFINHLNGLTEKAQLAIVVRNPSDSDTLTVTTTRKGEIKPSVFANLIGSSASADFLINDTQEQKLTVPPQREVFYTAADMLPGQGLHYICDVETDGEAVFSIVTMEPGETPYNLGKYRQIDYTPKVRGTFSVSDIVWEADASKLQEAVRISIGDDETDKLIRGRDSVTKQAASNPANHGIDYRIRLHHPRKAAIVLFPRGGYFQGPVKINGSVVMVPDKGGLTSLDGGQLLYRTTGTEDVLDIEFMPSEGTALPVDLLVYPLEEKE